MPKVEARVIYGSVRRKGAGEIVLLSRRDARLLARLGRVEAVDAADSAAFADRQVKKPSKRATPVKGAKPAKNAPKAKATKKAKPA